MPGAGTPGGLNGIAYYRLHGSPRTYWSRYDANYIATLARAIVAWPPTVQVWCIFDNKASGAAFETAWELQEAVMTAYPRPDARR